MRRSTDTPMSGPTDARGFRHEAFFYADTDEFLGWAVPFVRAGLEAEEAILVALPRDTLAPLRGALDGEGELVRFAAMEELGRNPGRIISAWHDFIDAQVAVDRGARGIGEPIWAGRRTAELEEAVRHEALLNFAFADGPDWILACPYNTSQLDDRTLWSAEHTHPAISRPDRAEPSGCFAPLPDGGPFAGELEPPPADAATLPFAAEGLSEVRRFVAAEARLAGLDGARRADLVLVANEVATNSVRHGAGRGSVRVWREGEEVVCEVRDRGRIDPGKPLIGRRRPSAEEGGGRGLWIAHQLCDLVQVRSGAGGSAVRMRMASATV
jgi:anti-sigma regulatory factor (Ser/Thr protein kinase)